MKLLKRNRILFYLSCVLLCLFGFDGESDAKKKTLTLASTASTLDSGLFDVLMPPFEKKYDCGVKIIAVGTGQAIRIAKDGNADVILVHDRKSEEQFVAEGYGIRRFDVMHNDFFIVGPESDPAGIKGMNALGALRKIYEVKSDFASRGDDSGTHKKELYFWKKLTVQPSGNWYLESGSGMEITLRIANEKMAYSLCDRATWLSHRKEMDALVVLVKDDTELFNPYSVIIVSPAKYPWVQYDLAKKFVEYLRGKEGQDIIKSYGVDKFGEPLFYPDVIK